MKAFIAIALGLLLTATATARDLNGEVFTRVKVPKMPEPNAVFLIVLDQRSTDPSKDRKYGLAFAQELRTRFPNVFYGSAPHGVNVDVLAVFAAGLKLTEFDVQRPTYMEQPNEFRCSNALNTVNCKVTGTRKYQNGTETTSGGSAGYRMQVEWSFYTPSDGAYADYVKTSASIQTLVHANMCTIDETYRLLSRHIVDSVTFTRNSDIDIYHKSARQAGCRGIN